MKGSHHKRHSYSRCIAAKANHRLHRHRLRATCLATAACDSETLIFCQLSATGTHVRMIGSKVQRCNSRVSGHSIWGAGIPPVKSTEVIRTCLKAQLYVVRPRSCFGTVSRCKEEIEASERRSYTQCEVGSVQ